MSKNPVPHGLQLCKGDKRDADLSVGGTAGSLHASICFGSLSKSSS